MVPNGSCTLFLNETEFTKYLILIYYFDNNLSYLFNINNI